jgi:hypothetical protein
VLDELVQHVLHVTAPEDQQSEAYICDNHSGSELLRGSPAWQGPGGVIEVLGDLLRRGKASPFRWLARGEAGAVPLHLCRYARSAGSPAST